MAFVRMCALVGVDPLAEGGGGGGTGKAGWVAEILGVGLGDFSLELGVQIVDICVSTRERNGGLIEMTELIRLLSKLRGHALPEQPDFDSVGSAVATAGGKGGGGRISEEDVIRAIRVLKPLGAGYEVIELGGLESDDKQRPGGKARAGGGRKMVCSVPRELDEDQSVVLGVAREGAGRVTEGMIVRRTGWTVDRARSALENAHVRDGLCWVDEQDEECGRAYWVVSVMRWDE
jgi:ESCRT-II complex subunit VPS22